MKWTFLSKLFRPMTEAERVREAINRDSERAVKLARIETARYRGQDRVLEHPDGRRL